jgi:hypothetical protein
MEVLSLLVGKNVEDYQMLFTYLLFEKILINYKANIIYLSNYCLHYSMKYLKSIELQFLFDKRK